MGLILAIAGISLHNFAPCFLVCEARIFQSIADTHR
jgi:hypothetical protein